MGQVLAFVEFRETDFIVNFVGEFVSRRARVRHVNGTTKKAEELAEARYAGWLDGMATALATHINRERLKKYGPYREILTGRKWIPAVEFHDAVRFFEWVWHEHDEGDHSEADFYSLVVLRYDELVTSQGIEDELEEMHRAAVLAGTVEPTAADEEWLIERAESLRAVAQPAEAAIARLREKQGTNS